MGFWDEVPDAIRVDLTTLSIDEKIALMKEHIDEGKATQLITAIDGSASDYEANMNRIATVLNLINVATNGAIRVSKILS